MPVSEQAKKDFLRKCVQEKDTEMVEIMLKANTPIDSIDFLMAIKNADHKMLTLLFKNMPTWLKEKLGTTRCYDKSTILHEAAMCGNVKVSKVILDNLQEYKDYLVREVNGSLYTVLQLAALKGDLESVIYFSQQCLELDYITHEKIYGTSAINLVSGPHKEEMEAYLTSLTNELGKTKLNKKVSKR